MRIKEETLMRSVSYCFGSCVSSGSSLTFSGLHKIVVTVVIAVPRDCLSPRLFLSPTADKEGEVLGPNLQGGGL